MQLNHTIFEAFDGLQIQGHVAVTSRYQWNAIPSEHWGHTDDELVDRHHEVSTESGSDRVSLISKIGTRTIVTRSLPLSVLTSSLTRALLQTELLSRCQQCERFANTPFPGFRPFGRVNPNDEVTAIGWR